MLPWSRIYGTVQYSTVQNSTVRYSTVQYSTVRHRTVQYGTVQNSTVRYSTVPSKQYNSLLHLHYFGACTVPVLEYTVQYSTQYSICTVQL